MVCVFFFKQQTAYEMRIRDWSSDVCSSDLTGDHQMAEPGRQAVAGIVLHRALFGGGAKRFRNALGSVIVVGRKGHADMAIVENLVVLAVSFLALVQRLRAEERLKAVNRPEGERSLEEVEPPQRLEILAQCQQPGPVPLP